MLNNMGRYKYHTNLEINNQHQRRSWCCLEKKMTESNVDMGTEAIKAWYTKVLHAMTREMIKIKAVAGPAVEARPVWLSPYKILISRVWEASQKSDFIWTISGEGVITDHIAGNLAATPREVVRHFSLKWQMDADQLLLLAKNKSPVKDTEEHMEAYTTKLIQYAESLYDLASRDDVWQQKP